LKNYGGYFEVDRHLIEIKLLEQQMEDPNLWNDQKKAKKTINRCNSLKKKVESIINVRDKINSCFSSYNLLEIEYDEEIYKLLLDDVAVLQQDIEHLEIEVLLSDKYDDLNCTFEIHSGAGGTEACDWALMLYRMYTRYFENKGFRYNIISYIEGEEVGLKSAVLSIEGEYAYGYLKCEKGVHRLVRLSPFDANHKRHTSFASVDVIPEFDDDVNIEINDKDLKIDVYRSGGAGGQSVNTADSAVRITHLPSKIVVTCQNERSQLQNKEKAMEMLKNKLMLIEIEKNKEKISDMKGTHKNIEFGSQIRSYVMHPYSLVKDHRTDIETSNVGKILDGDLDLFIEGFLRS